MLNLHENPMISMQVGIGRNERIGIAEAFVHVKSKDKSENMVKRSINFCSKDIKIGFQMT